MFVRSCGTSILSCDLVETNPSYPVDADCYTSQRVRAPPLAAESDLALCDEIWKRWTANTHYCCNICPLGRVPLGAAKFDFDYCSTSMTKMVGYSFLVHLYILESR